MTFSVHAVEQQGKLLALGSFKRWPKCYSKHERAGCDRAAKDDNGSNELVDLKKWKYISLVFYYFPYKYVSLVVM